MSKSFTSFVAALSLVVVSAASFHAQAPAARAQTTIAERTTGMQKLDGFFPLYWDERAGTLWLEVPRFDSDFLLATGLAEGLGSNDIGLDRGISGAGRVVRFERVGPKVLLVQMNQNFRSSSPNPAERKSVEDSFAKSILWGFTVAAEGNGRVLVDATDFVLRDGFGAAGSLRPGNYRVDRVRSAVYMQRTKAFPKNTEIEVTLTFGNDAPGGGGGGAGPAQGPVSIGDGGGRSRLALGGLFSGSVGSVTPTADSVTLREHYSLVELPDGNFKPRIDDPRAGYGGLTYLDYSAPIGESIQQRFVRRHRLEKKDPNAEISDPIKPIEYWVDPGAPEDVRRALIEGASWWAQAFEAAGFRNAFKVAVLPDGADPMDIRYNMINWVHRSTRGWSTGGSISDPRTGEIIKATVTLGSLRDRQDYMIFEGLLSPYRDGDEKPSILYEAALKRIRQLAAHETGHTLGLGHNFYDSSKGWQSVMDYPHPLEKLREDGTIDLNDAYPQRIGDWDKVAINYGYRQFAAGTDEKAALRKILDDSWAQDIRYFTNQDMDVNPRVDWWSNGVNQADELNRIMKVRATALEHIGAETIRNGQPMATIEEPLVPVYMYHRYAVESTASMLGGQEYIYAIRGDGRTPTKWVSGQQQRAAIDALVATLKPSVLTLSKRILDSIPPRPPGYGRHRELFPRTTGDAFDPLAPASIASDVTIGFALELDRAARIVSQHAVDSTLPGLEEIIDRLTKATFDAVTANSYEAEVRRVEENALVDRVMWLASGSPNSQVRAIASLKLSKLSARMKAETGKSEADQAHHSQLTTNIKRFLERPADFARPIYAPDAPPGAPIGDAPMDWLARPKY